MKASLPPDEAQRLAALREYAVLDTPAEASFDDLTELAAYICEAPIALITLIDEDRQWFKSRVNFDPTETKRDIAFCAHVIHEKELTIVPNATLDARFSDNPLVLGEPGIRFYAGAPLTTPDGYTLGSLCVLDRKPREMRADHQLALRVLSRHVMTQLELRRRKLEVETLRREREQISATLQQEHSDAERIQQDRARLAEAEQAGQRLLETAEQSRRALLSVLEDQKQIEASLRESERRFRATFDQAAMGIAMVALDGHWLSVNQKLCDIFGYTREELLALSFQEMTHPDDLDINLDHLRQMRAGEISTYSAEKRYFYKDGTIIWASLTASLVRTDLGVPDYFIAVIEDISERKRMGEALKESERHFQRVLDSVLAFSGILTPDGVMTFANKTALDAAGITLNDVVGKPLVETHWLSWSTAVQQRAHEAIQRASAGEIVRYDEQICIAGGRIIDAEISIIAMRDAEGHVTHLIPSGIDITERKRAEETLRESEARFRLLFERSPAPMMVYERASLKLLAVNEAYLAQYGYSLEEALAMLLPDLYPESEKAAITDLIPHLHGHAYVGEWHHRRKDGTLVNIVAYSHDIDYAGLGARIAVIHDITERKRTEDALRMSEARYRTLLETAPFPIVITRLDDGILRYGNRRAEGKFGIPLDQGIGKLASNFYLDAEERNQFLARLLRETVVSDHELRLRTADGASFWAQLSAAIIEFEGEPAIFSSINDISARKQAEDEVHQLNAALELRVTERTAQLLTVNKELEAFTYSVSHDLKAPLRGIDGYSKLLLEDHAAQLNEEGQTFLNNIRLGAKHMAQLIEDLLAYSRLERRAFQVDQVDAAALVNKILSEQADEIARRSVKITLEITEQTLHADRDGVAMILRNLIDNAIKFTGRVKSPHIEIGLRGEEGACILWVRDNGIGFDMNFHERIFEIFQRLQLAEDFPGTGIGLAIVRKAAKRMGGRIWGESSPTQGATFYLELPI